jgi:hypothetical protein
VNVPVLSEQTSSRSSHELGFEFLDNQIASKGKISFYMLYRAAHGKNGSLLWAVGSAYSSKSFFCRVGCAICNAHALPVALLTKASHKQYQNTPSSENAGHFLRLFSTFKTAI